MKRGARRAGILQRALHVLAATLPVWLALLAWFVLAPRSVHHVWAWFYPAVFASAWIGGRLAGLTATAIAMLLAGWLLLLLEPPLAEEEPAFVWPAVLFAGTGVLFSIGMERLQRRLRSSRAQLVRMQMAQA